MLLKRPQVQDVNYVPSVDDLPEVLAKIVRPNDLVITMGAGSINQYGQNISYIGGRLTMKDKKIIVLMGGPSKEAEVSRRTGAAIAEALESKGYNAQTLELNPQHCIKRY